MPPVNRYYKGSKLSEVKFRYLPRLFALDLTASAAARLTGLSVRALHDVYLRLRRRLPQRCPVPVELGGALEPDASCFGPRRVRGKRGRGAGSKPIAFGLFKRGGQGYTEIVPDCSKKTLQGIIRGKIGPAAMGNTDGWRGYDGLVDVGFDRPYRVLHRHNEFVRGAAHSNGIESFWSFAKSRLHQFAGVPKPTFLLHLKACAFRFKHRYQDLYKVLLKELRQQPLKAGAAS